MSALKAWLSSYERWRERRWWRANQRWWERHQAWAAKQPKHRRRR